MNEAGDVQFDVNAVGTFGNDVLEFLIMCSIFVIVLAHENARRMNLKLSG